MKLNFNFLIFMTFCLQIFKFTICLNFESFLYTIQPKYNVVTPQHTQFYLSSDQQFFITAPTLVINQRMFYLYNVDESNITFISQTPQNSINGGGSTFPVILLCSDTLQFIVTYSGATLKVRLYRRTHLSIQLIQQFTPLPAGCDTFQLSYDGRYFNTGLKLSKQFVSYVYDGSQYVMIANLTLNTKSNVRAITPDGIYVLYGQNFAVQGSSYFRILQNNGLRPEVYINNFSAPAVPANAIINKIYSSMPVSGLYDILINIRINSIPSIVYLLFNSSDNTANIIQSLPSTSVTITNCYFTRNGIYFGCMANTTTLILYQKISGLYTIINQLQRFTSSSILFYISQTASMISLRQNSTTEMIFLFQCNVLNCFKCRWKDRCQRCNDQLVLVENSCICPQGEYNLSGSCILCDGIAKCIGCSSNNVCSMCQSGYQLLLSNNTCICPINKNVSSINGKCVQCNISNCYKCSQDNICELFLPPNIPSNIQILQKTEKMIVSLVIVIVIIFAVLIIGIVMVFRLIMKFNISTVDSHNRKMQNQQQNKKLSQYEKYENQKANQFIKDNDDNKINQSLYELKENTQSNLIQPNESQITYFTQNYPKSQFQAQIQNYNQLQLKLQKIQNLKTIQIKSRKKRTNKNNNNMQQDLQIITVREQIPQKN